MRNLGLILASIVTIIIAIRFLPPFVIYIIGCYQIGSWIGDFVRDRWE